MEQIAQYISHEATNIALVTQNEQAVQYLFVSVDKSQKGLNDICQLLLKLATHHLQQLG